MHRLRLARLVLEDKLAAGLRHQLQDPIQVQMKPSVGSIRQGRGAQREVRGAHGACECGALSPGLESEEWSDATVVRDDCELLGLLPRIEGEEQSDGVYREQN